MPEVRSATLADEDLVPAWPDAVAAAVATELRRCDVAAAAVAVFDRDGIRFAGASGWADLARDEAATATTLFRAASVSKLVTSTLALQQVAAGRLELDGNVNTLLDDSTKLRDAEGREVPVTLRRLLAHTSGLMASSRGIELSNPVLSRLANGAKTARDLHTNVQGLTVADPPPPWPVYANAGMNLIGHLVATVTGRSFEDAARDDVFAPLGMERTHFARDLAGPGTATRYGDILRGGRLRQPLHLIFHALPMGALATSVSEFSRFGRAMLGGGELDGVRVIDADLLAEAWTRQSALHPDCSDGFGLGWMVREQLGRRVVGHDGYAPGISARFMLSPSDGIGVIVLTNVQNFGCSHTIAEIAFTHALGITPAPIDTIAAGIPDDSAEAWAAFTRRMVGRWTLRDYLPPGPLETIVNRMEPATVEEATRGILVLSGRHVGDRPIWLYPDGKVGRYRVAHPSLYGSRAVAEFGLDGGHLVFGANWHFLRPLPRH